MKRAENRKLLLSLLAGFLAFYFVAMAIFTYQVYWRYYQSGHSIFLMKMNEAAADLEKALAVPAEGEVGLNGEPPYKEKKYRELAALQILNDLQGGTDWYVKASLFKTDKEPYLQSGNYLWLSWGYVNLDELLSAQELEALGSYMLKVDSYDYHGESKAHEEKDYRIEVSGYLKGGEAKAIPKSIKLIEQKLMLWPDDELTLQNSDSGPFLGTEDFAAQYFEIPVSSWSVTVLEEHPVQEYTFQPGDTEGEYAFEERSATADLEGYKNTGIAFRPGVLTNHSEARHMRRAQERYALCAANAALDLDWSNAWWPQLEQRQGLHIFSDRLQKVHVGGQLYYLRAKCLFYPLEAAMGTLLPVWLFSLAMVVLLSFILYWQLSRLWKKERAMEENRRQLMNAMAHDLKTPLGIIRAYSEGLAEKVAEGKREHYCAVIVGETERMDRMLRELLELSKLESGAGRLALDDCDIAALLREQVQRYACLPEGKKLALSCSQGNCVVKADRLRMEQAVANLLSNALRFTPEGKSIYISLTGMRLTIENEGAPIPEEQLPHIWDAFYKAGVCQGESVGSGLGLAIVKKLLDLHGFACGAENTARGVLFWIDFSGKRE